MITGIGRLADRLLQVVVPATSAMAAADACMNRCGSSCTDYACCSLGSVGSLFWIRSCPRSTGGCYQQFSGKC